MDNLTHAGGIVVRYDKAEPHYLIVTASTDTQQMVIPKGHIESGESPSETALREIREEAGVEASIIAPIDSVEIDIGGKIIKVIYFLLEYIRDIPARENRKVLWLPYEKALETLSFEDSREILRKSQNLI